MQPKLAILIKQLIYFQVICSGGGVGWRGYSMAQRVGSKKWHFPLFISLVTAYAELSGKRWSWWGGGGTQISSSLNFPVCGLSSATLTRPRRIIIGLFRILSSLDCHQGRLLNAVFLDDNTECQWPLECCWSWAWCVGPEGFAEVIISHCWDLRSWVKTDEPTDELTALHTAGLDQTSPSLPESSLCQTLIGYDRHCQHWDPSALRNVTKVFAEKTKSVKVGFLLRTSFQSGSVIGTRSENSLKLQEQKVLLLLSKLPCPIS